MESDIIKISHLNKSFGEVKAVNDLSFRVKKGELFALSRFLVVEPDADFIFLHTHTWAYKAVGMYQKMGFRITKKALPTSRTDFSCMDVLKDVLPNSIIAQLLEKD